MIAANKQAPLLRLVPCPLTRLLKRHLNLVVLGLLPLLVSGCASASRSSLWPVLVPGGPVAIAERNLMLLASAVMLAVILPVIGLTLWVAYRYRAGTADSPYRPDWDNSAKIDAVVWAIPAIIVLTLAGFVWIKTHQLDPYRPLPGAEAGQSPLVVQAVALDWKWLFIYPGQNIAAVNELALPVGRPVRIEITSDTVMNALYIPALSGQVYAMAGMRTEINLMADKAGKFVGRNSQYSGFGFAQQHFTVRALPPEDFNIWIKQAEQTQRTLTPAVYQVLAKPSRAQPVAFFGQVTSGLFNGIIRKNSEHNEGHGNAR